MPKVLERFYVVFTLLYLARGVFPVESSQGDVSHWTEFNAVSFSTQVLLFAILGLLIFVRWDTVVEALRVSRSGWFWPMAVCAMTIASTVWSGEPLFTLRRALLLTATTAFAVYLGACFDPDEQLDLFGWMAVVSVLGSFLMAGLFPRYGLSHDLHAGDWKGLFPHKNGLGLQMAFAITVLFIGRPKDLPKWLVAISGLGAAILLVLSHSATSLALTVLILGMYGAFHIFRIRRRRTLPLWVALAPLALTLLLGMAIERDAFLDLLSRDATFTGRTQLWSAVVDAIQARPVLGYGYAVFWRWGASGDARDVVNAIRWTGVEQAHNGYLDLCLDLGFSGLLLFVCGFCAAFCRAAKRFVNRDGGAAKWPLMFLIFFCLYNFVEGSLLQLYTFLWVPYVMVFISLASAHVHSRENELDSDLAAAGSGDEWLTAGISPE